MLIRIVFIAEEGLCTKIIVIFFLKDKAPKKWICLNLKSISGKKYDIELIQTDQISVMSTTQSPCIRRVVKTYVVEMYSKLHVIVTSVKIKYM